MKLSKEKKRAVNISLKSSLGSVLGIALRVPVNILSAWLLGPINLGAFKIIGLIVRYADYNHLGFLQAITRQIPIAMGRGDQKEIESVKDICISSNLLATFLTIIVLWGLYLSGVNFKGSFDLTIMLLVSFILFFQRADSLLHSYIKGVGHFDLIAKRNLYLNNIMPLINLVFLAVWKLKGLVFGTLVLALMGFIYYFQGLKPISFNFRLPLKKTWELLKIGLILFTNKAADGFFWTADLTIIAIMLPRQDVGLYGFALGSVSVVTGVISMLNMIVYRKILLEQSTTKGIKNYSSFKKYPEYYVPLLLTTTAMLLGVIFLGYAFIVNTFLHKYIESLPCIILLSFGYLSFITRYFTFSFLNATDQLRYQIFYTLLATALNYGLDYVFIKAGYGIVGVAMGCSISFVVVSGMMLLHVYHNIYRKFIYGVVHLGKILGCSLIISSLMWYFSSVNFISPYSSHLLAKVVWFGTDAIIKLFIYIVICIGLFSLVFRRENVFPNIKIYAEYAMEILIIKMGLKNSESEIG